MTGRSSLTFLKLGGSLITDKTRPHTPRLGVLTRLAEEIARACRENPGLQIILGHGSGSFGHVPAKMHSTRLGVNTPQEWSGFVEVWREAWQLNQLVMQALAGAGLPALAFAPLPSLLAEGGDVLAWNLEPIELALKAGLLPVIYGDVVFDRRLGGTILSTENLFEHLATHLLPERILLAGLEAGVWADFPTCSRRIERISPHNWHEIQPALSGSSATDVTGGMLSKVETSLVLTQRIDGLEVRIFSGNDSGSVYQALMGSKVGTLICA